MFYVYLIQSIKNPVKTYIGFTTNLEERIERHNSERSEYTSDYAPWKLISYVAFTSKSKAQAFEKHIKVGSGNAFAKRHLF